MHGGDPRFVLVFRETRLDGLVRRYSTVAQARFYVEHLGADFQDYLDEDRVYKQGLESVRRQLAVLGRVQILDRSFLSNFIFGPEEIVVVYGQDGLVVNTLKYLREQPILAVNPDPGRNVGKLLPFGVSEVTRIAQELLADHRTYRQITLAQARLSDGRELLAANDIFIGPRRHTSAAYLLRHGDREERQLSSGLIISTGLGSSGWMKSVLAGAEGVLRGLLGEKKLGLQLDFPWNADQLYYSVREPIEGKQTGAELVFGQVDHTAPLSVQSLMPEEGVIFSDGMVDDCLTFESGMTANIATADWCAYLVV